MTGHVKAATANHPENQRLDKWLWYIRAVKSRTLAASLVTDGKVRVNRIKTEKPSLSIKPGDVITLNVRGNIRVLEVLQLGVRRGPASEAALLFKELTEPAPTASSGAGATVPLQSPSPAHRDPGTGRPTKRDRRQIDRFLDQD